MSADRMSVLELRDILICDSDNGTLIWKPRRSSMFRPGNTGRDARRDAWNKVHAGAPALVSVKENKYLYGRVCNKNMYAHRVIWAMHHGDWPAGEVDHVNGDRTDNRISNLRDVTHVQNARNVSVRDGRVFTGIYFDKKWGKWYENVGRNGAFGSECFGMVMKSRNNKYRAGGYSERHIKANEAGCFADGRPADA